MAHSDGHVRTCLWTIRSTACDPAAASALRRGGLVRVLRLAGRRARGRALLAARGQRAVADKQMVGIGG
jgi:hypothetical protein